jgi:transposase InsO family protein
MGIRDKPIAAGSPWQNGYAERLIGTIRRECIDHMIVFGEAHLRRIIGEFAAYYNKVRVHRLLDQEPVCVPRTSSGVPTTSDPAICVMKAAKNRS